MYTLHSFAKIVKALRAVQCSAGSGYKTPAAKTAATALEKEVDAAITWVENHPFPFIPEKGSHVP